MRNLPRGRRLIAFIGIAATLGVTTACDPPPLERLPLRQEGGAHEVVFAGERGPRNITFRNDSGAAVTVAGGEFYTRTQSVYGANPAGCVGVIAAGARCIMSFTKPGANNVNQWYYLGQANEKALGGVILQP